ncbi:hypothetical protein BJ170DRAFT_594027 [Xylariales sp. AK1849]|nr:hypothetical protein BJ170DRAFT_594027 [Xylariales sp. AK1849]
MPTWMAPRLRGFIGARGIDNKHSREFLLPRRNFLGHVETQDLMEKNLTLIFQALLKSQEFRNSVDGVAVDLCDVLNLDSTKYAAVLSNTIDMHKFGRRNHLIQHRHVDKQDHRTILHQLVDEEIRFAITRQAHISHPSESQARRRELCIKEMKQLILEDCNILLRLHWPGVGDSGHCSLREDFGRFGLLDFSSIPKLDASYEVPPEANAITPSSGPNSNEALDTSSTSNTLVTQFDNVNSEDNKKEREEAHPSAVILRNLKQVQDNAIQMLDGMDELRAASGKLAEVKLKMLEDNLRLAKENIRIKASEMQVKSQNAFLKQEMSRLQQHHERELEMKDDITNKNVE